MRCFMAMRMRRFTGLGWFAHHAAVSRPGGCAMGIQGFGGVLAAPLVGGGRRRRLTATVSLREWRTITLGDWAVLSHQSYGKRW